MSTFVSQDIQARMDEAHGQKAVFASTLSMSAGGQRWPILRMWDTGFALAQADLPSLRGFVDIHDGEAHVFQALIVASEIVGPEVHCTFKRMTAIRSAAPLDFEAAYTPIELRLTRQPD